MWTDAGNMLITHRQMNVEIRTEAAQFPGKEYINGIFVAVYTAYTLLQVTEILAMCALRILN
jgi:hypothetical protein